MPLLHLLPRQVTDDTNDNNRNDVGDYYGGWWYSDTAYIIKWAVIVAIFFIFLAFFLGGYLHARKRMKKGLAPLPYHRWMIPRRKRLLFHSQHPELPNPYPPAQYHVYNYGAAAPYRPGYGEQRSYPMGPMGPGQAAWGPPPPAYGEAEYVPPYAPPGKTNPDQNVQVREQGVGGAQERGVGGAQESGVVGGSSQGQGYHGGDLGNRIVR